MYKYNLFPKLTVLIIMLGLCHIVQGKKLSGYIVTENNDTIQGEIKVHSFNRRTGDFVFAGIDLESCYRQVAFRSKGELFFKYYLPEQIKEYAFTYKNQPYLFQRFLIRKKSIVPNERNIYQFLQLVKSDNKGNIYRGSTYVPMPGFEVWTRMPSFTFNPKPIYSYYRYIPGNKRIIVLH